jgi:gas vesicle structural protein
VSLVGIELLTIDVRVVIASVDTYLRFAEAVDRVRLEVKGKTLPEFAEDMTRGVSGARPAARSKARRRPSKSRSAG